MADASRAAVFPRRFVAGAAALGLLVRLAFALLYWTGQPLTRDELEYPRSRGASRPATASRMTRRSTSARPRRSAGRRAIRPF
jgi:hypothetical protein